MLPIVFLCVALLGSLGASPLAAQIVRGTLSEAGSGRPLGGALVVLLGPGGRQLTGTLSDDTGSFRIRAPAPGRYQLRAERIGYRSTLSPVLELAAGQTLEHRLTAPYEAIRLAGIDVRGEKRCIIRPREGLQVHALWEEARKALNATALTQAQRLFPVRVVQYERELHPQTLRVLREQRTTTSGYAERPFFSRPAEDLAREGYVRQAADGVWYFAPDAEVLLSDVFLDDHCLRIQSARSDQPELIGLAFEPVRRRDLPDIQGVFWLDERTAELRYLEFGYTGLPVRLRPELQGGRVEFKRMPSGAWIVQRWWIRMPGLATVATARQQGLPGDRAGAGSGSQVRTVKEQGGEVTVLLAVDAPSAGSSASVRGVVYDSTRAAPLPGALVFLSGTQHAVTAGSDGHFHFEDLPEGSYTISFLHPRLDSLGFVPIPRAVDPRPGESVELELAIPSLAAILTAACPQAAPHAGTGMITGRVHDAQSGTGIRGAEVVLSWSPRGGGTSRTELTVTTDADGRYRACGVPAGVAVTLQARWGARASTRAVLRLQGEPLRQDLEVASDR